MELTLSQRIHNAVSSLEVENVKAVHAYLNSVSSGLKEYGVIWTNMDDTSWGHGDGRMYGIENVKIYQVNHRDYKAYTNYIDLIKVYPQVGGKDPHPLWDTPLHTLATDIIEVAADGMSARAYYMTPGLIFSWLNCDQKPSALGLWERYGTDYLLVDGDWLIHHDQVCPDTLFGLDKNSNWARNSYMKLREGNHKPEKDFERWGRNHIGWIHRQYSAVQTPQDTVPWPEPYETFDYDDNYATVPFTPF